MIFIFESPWHPDFRSLTCMSGCDQQAWKADALSLRTCCIIRSSGKIGNRSLDLFRAICPTTLDVDHVFPQKNPAVRALLAGPHSGEQVIAAIDSNLRINIMQVGFDGRERNKQLASD